MCQVSFGIPNEVLYDTHMTVDDASKFSREMTALGYYTRNNISIGYCAQIAEMTEEEFMEFLGQNKVDVFRFTDDDELLRDVRNA